MVGYKQCVCLSTNKEHSYLIHLLIGCTKCLFIGSPRKITSRSSLSPPLIIACFYLSTFQWTPSSLLIYPLYPLNVTFRIEEVFTVETGFQAQFKLDFFHVPRKFEWLAIWFQQKGLSQTLVSFFNCHSTFQSFHSSEYLQINRDPIVNVKNEKNRII